MQRVTFLVAALATLSTAAPLESTVPCTDSYKEHMRNASAAFGWQLAGAAKGTDDIDATCNGLKTGAYTKWAEQGLFIDYIAAPLCNSSTAPNAELALPKVVEYNTKVYTTLLLNSFDSNNTNVWNYLCNNLRFKQIDNFLLDSSNFINSACNAGFTKLNPRPFTAIGVRNATALQDYKESASKLFAWQYASSANSPEQLGSACQYASTEAAQTKWDSLQLDPQCVEQTICSFQTPLTVADVKAKMREWRSKQYVTVMSNASNAPGYQRWLCRNLRAEKMSQAGLDGSFVKGQVCDGVQA